MSRVKIAFVASGGAARGLAHLGVLRACEEIGLLPEIFVGTRLAPSSAPPTARTSRST
jgi:predicted acylesterase/phospholipase RssA